MFHTRLAHIKRDVVVASFLFSALLSSFNASSQVIFKDINSPAVQALVKGKTYVVLTNDENFDSWFRSAVSKYWKVTQVQFINTGAELDTFVKSDKNVFLFAQARDDRGAAVHLLNTDDIIKKKEFTLMLSQGGHKLSKYLCTPSTNGQKIIGNFRYDPSRSEITAGLFEAEMLLALMNQSLQLIIDNSIKGNVRDSVKARIIVMAPAFKEKTMLINKAYNDGSIELEKRVIVADKIIDDYPFSSQLVGKDSVEIFVNEATTAYCYLFLYYPTQYVSTADDSGDVLVYDIANQSFVFFDDNIDGPWLEKWEMKEMIYMAKD